MFEDSTFESSGRIRTRSRGWMIAAFIFNGSILLALILIPLIYPEALPHQAIAFLMQAPAPQAQQQPLRQEPVHAVQVNREMMNEQIFAPPRIPKYIVMVDKPESLPPIDVARIGGDSEGPAGPGSIFPGKTATPVIRPEIKVRVSSAVEEGLLIQKTVPRYPPIAIAARIEGTVVLQATISKAGTIENLRVASGPPMLQQAALDAVKTWLYRPYLLDGQPVEVETTVNVIFTLGR
ncbi:MAG TPA: TonB family protein [Terracidiphilus sp.]|nr:TonB family protein [Terracidiphilus sp.]